MAGQETPAPLAPLTDPAAATGPTNIPSADALAQGQQQAGRMYTLDPNYRPQQEQRIRPQVKQTGFLGNGQVAQARASGGDPLFAATLAVPTLELDRSLQSIQRQKDDIEKWMADATTQFKGRAADPYQKAYQDYVSQEHNKFFDDVAQNYYGGNRSKAIQAVRRDPELNRQFMNMNRSLGAIGDANKSGYAYYEKVADAITKGQAEVDPETQKLLNEAMNGEWSFNNMGPAHNAAQFDRLHDRLSLNKMFNEFYREGIASAGDVTETWSVQRDPKTGRKFLVIPKEKNYDEFVDAFVDQAMKDAPYRDRDEVRKFVEARVPRESTVTVDELALGTGGSQQPQRPVISNFQITEDAMVPKINGHAGSVMTFKLQDKDRKPLTETFQFVSPGGAQRSMVPDRLSADKNGKVYIIGKDPTVTEVSVEDAAKARSLEERIKDLGADIDREKRTNSELGQNALSPEKMSEKLAPLQKARDEMIAQKAGIEKTTTKRNAEFALPLDLNEAPIRATFGDEYVDKVKKNAEAYRMQSTGPAKSAPKTSADRLGIL